MSPGLGICDVCDGAFLRSEKLHHRYQNLLYLVRKGEYTGHIKSRFLIYFVTCNYLQVEVII